MEEPGGWNPDGGAPDRKPGMPGDPTPRAKTVVVLVVTAVLIATLVLCCVAAGELGKLFFVRLPSP